MSTARGVAISVLIYLVVVSVLLCVILYVVPCIKRFMYHREPEPDMSVSDDLP